jgi:hypothetical protein
MAKHKISLFNLQLSMLKIGGQIKKNYAQPFMELPSFMLRYSMKGQTKKSLFGLQVAG